MLRTYCIKPYYSIPYGILNPAHCMGVTFDTNFILSPALTPPSPELHPVLTFSKHILSWEKGRNIIVVTIFLLIMNQT